MDLDLKKAEITNPIAWILNNNIVNENGSLIEFSSHKFLIDPYLDFTPRQVCMKSAQIGWSTLAILKSFHLAKYANANIIHTFPSQHVSKDFVTPKVDPLIARNPCIKQMVGTDSASLKQVGERFIFYRGAYDITEAISISAHILMEDEFDRSNQKILETYKSRLDSAKLDRPELGWEWRFSNPSVPGYGVDQWWTESDQKHWFVKCHKCNYEWYLSFPDSINFETKERICEHCGHPYTPDDLINGRWVKKYLHREKSGYWISQLFIPWITAEKIIEDSQGDQDFFYNFTLGLPFISKDTALSRESIIKCISPGYNPRTNVAIGVDNGIDKHYIIGNKYGIFEIGVTDDWRVIEDLRNQYDAIMVIDALPYPNTPRKLAEKYPGKVFMHWFVPDRKQAGIIRWEGLVVRSDRLKIIDSVVGDFNARDITINMTQSRLEDFIYHWKQLYRIIKVTPQGYHVPTWESIENRPDHFAFATVYWRIALDQTLGQGGIVNAPTPTRQRGHPMIGPDLTTMGLDLKEVARKTTIRRRNWKNL